MLLLCCSAQAIEKTLHLGHHSLGSQLSAGPAETLNSGLAPSSLMPGLRQHPSYGLSDLCLPLIPLPGAPASNSHQPPGCLPIPTNDCASKCSLVPPLPPLQVCPAPQKAPPTSQSSHQTPGSSSIPLSPSALLLGLA